MHGRPAVYGDCVPHTPHRSTSNRVGRRWGNNFVFTRICDICRNLLPYAPVIVIRERMANVSSLSFSLLLWFINAYIILFLVEKSCATNIFSPNWKVFKNELIMLALDWMYREKYDKETFNLRKRYPSESLVFWRLIYYQLASYSQWSYVIWPNSQAKTR
jgi:hypothetical protein